MKKLLRKKVVIVMVAGGLLLTANVQADLSEPISGTAYINGVAYENIQAVYDDELDITYLDIPVTSDYFKYAQGFVEDILWVSDGYDDSYSDWRLPETRGTLINEYNMAGSELGHLYYIALGNISYVDFMECWNELPEECEDTGLVNEGPFENLVEGRYWYGDNENVTYVSYAPYFDFAYGYQGEYAKAKAPLYILPVRDGAISTEDDGGDMTVECGTLTDEFACEQEEACHWNGRKCKDYPNM